MFKSPKIGQEAKDDDLGEWLLATKIERVVVAVVSTKNRSK